MTKENDNYPPIRFPRELKEALASEARERAESRGVSPTKYSIADYVAERRQEWLANETDPNEDE